MSTSAHSRKRVSYYNDSDIGNYNYGKDHPMKPHRIRMTHNLILNYGLYRKMEIYRPHKATAEEIKRFHSDDYVNFLSSIRPDNVKDYKKQINQFTDEDCPIFPGLFDFCQSSAGGSLGGAVKLNKNGADICINWSGGLHHAHKSEAAGFCYVNDIVLSILELLKYHQRVLYIDIDVHHGDGVEEAFYTTDRVMTVSFHKYAKDFFPGFGNIDDVGAGKGKYYSVNIPLRDGINDASFESIFNPIVGKVMEIYQPSAIVLQCGADSLTGDLLGTFNLTLKGHGKCVEFVSKFNLPLLLVGGGGYTLPNVARCWTYETSVALSSELANDLPYNDYYEDYGPHFKLHIPPSNRRNFNPTKYLDGIKRGVFENLRNIQSAPGVQMMPIPEDGICVDEYEPEIKGRNKKERISMYAADKHITPTNEYSDSEDEGDGRRNEMSYCKKKELKRMKILEKEMIKET